MPAVISPPMEAQAGASAGKAPGNAITWPFHQKGWIGSLCMLLVGWFPLPVPFILTFGWMLEGAAREAEHNPDRLPRARNIPGMWLHGVVYILMVLIYFVIPMAIFSAIYAATVSRIGEDVFNWSLTWGANQIIEFFNGILSGTPFRIPLYDLEPYSRFFFRELTTFYEAVIPPVIFFMFAAALFLAGLVRYAATRKLSSFFRPFKNLRLAMAHLPSFLWTYLLILAMSIVATSLQLVGFILWITVGMWIYAHLIGRLAAKLRDAKAIG